LLEEGHVVVHQAQNRRLALALPDQPINLAIDRLGDPRLFVRQHWLRPPR
jgi:hypothetical protein